MNSILDLDATSLSAKIKANQLTPKEAAEAYINQIRATHPVINAVTEERFADALAEAEQMASRPKEGRLFGVPVSVKECFHVKGTKTTGGLSARTRIIDKEDAEIIRRLKREGAIILCKTNTPSLCFCQETDNLVFGRTNNPWNPSCSAGGSSGGEGALIAVGGAAVGIGADIGGSIRFPAHFNGVVGFKSGFGQVPHEGIFPPISHPVQQSMLGVGALAKSVDDAKLIHEILSGRHVPAASSRFSVIIPVLPAAFPMQKATVACLENMAAHLKNNVSVDHDPPPYLAESAQWWQWIMSVDGSKYLIGEILEMRMRHVATEWLKAKAGLPHRLHPYLTWALIASRLFKPTASTWRRFMEAFSLAKTTVQNYLQSRVLILPVYHSTAPAHGQQYREIFSVRRTFRKFLPFITYANTFGLPSLTLPVGEDENGMPLAVQLITATGQEELLFRLGKDLERTFRGYVRCDRYDPRT
ncbi:MULTISPECIES: amidase [unclassified Thermoactinomyces]|uniref:amidase n=1 Tax=unclassified Thermoactinomyces TaxID=2634588 RepID=UPI0018DBCF31|nr:MULTISPECIES: amidase [unclassified Thermoactinomyces]MBH8597214.1 amidase [Thermoactinomyces sp. CICC 10523]MBH8602774.1 amidase [Thermoactinomyces sp. CICC 10522]MBH8606117.1 amidase [Thermoactinomyces sp. CICC 10521]